MLFLPVALLVAGGAIFICLTQQHSIHAERANEEEQSLNVGVAAIGRTLQIADQDLVYLISRRVNRQVFDHPDEANLAMLGTDWVEFADAKRVYDKIRWIDEYGRERLRVNYENGRAVIVPASGLQDKHDRYFFSDTINLKAGQIYVSPLDLNVENNRLEVPYKPTIRFGIPVFDSKGNKRGIFLINYLASRVLERFSSNTVAHGTTAWLINQDGYWLKGPDPADEFGFIRGIDDLTMAVRYPDVWEKISEGTEGQFETKDGLWTFATVHPLREGEVSSTGSSDIIKPSMKQLDSNAYVWKAVGFLPAGQYNAGLVSFCLTLGGASLAVLALFFSGILRLVSYQMKERSARVDLEQTVRERTYSLQAANESLSIEQLRLRSLLQTMPDLVWLKDTNGVYLLCNHNFEFFFGATEKNIVGKTDYDFVSKEQADFFREKDMAAVEKGRPVTNEEWVTYAGNGRRVLLETTKVPVQAASGKLIGILGIGHDITSHREAEERERRLKNTYRALSATNESILHQMDESSLFARVCQIAVDYGEMVLAWIGIADLASERIVTGAHCGKASGLVDVIEVSTSPDKPEGRGAMGTAYREKRNIVINDFDSSEHLIPWREKARQFGVKSVAAFPILRAGKPYAVFSVYNDQVGAFDEEIVSLLDGMARNISFALDNFDKETERKQAEESLMLAAMVYQDSSEAMMVTDADNSIIAVNPAFEHITGYSSDEVIGKNPNIMKSGRQGSEVYREMWQSINTTGRWKGELWNRAKDGEEFAEMITINTTYNPDGSVLRRVALFSDITEKKESDDLIWQQANFDTLTGLPNRNLFRDHLRNKIMKAQRGSQPLALMFLDLDGFKDVNDTLGHDMGDILLKEAAYRLQGCVREIDTVARLGGDEFTVILSELQDPGNVDRVARHILQRMSAPFKLGDEVAHVSASIGITLYPQDGTEIEELTKNADQAMYAAKQEGKNRYHFFTASMQEAAIARMRLVNDLRGALEGNQFEVVYQPIIDLATGIIHKAEALIRWQHPTRGLINPVEFISAAEDTGMITSFGNWIFHEAARQAALWREKYRPEFQISVNISPIQFRNEGIDSSAWFDHLKSLGLPGQGIVVEITEGLLLDASPKITDQLLMLRDAGIEVSLDDFGTGYSSLSYLKKFDIDYIKIDQSFVRNLIPDSDDMALCEAIIVMAHKLNIKVIAEGIETDEQRDLLAGAGCDYGQGYLFSRPVSGKDFDALLNPAPGSAS
jgi:diguanylate cyclase (GGDEF)-like protein/PAS domain S-box-containing protein